MNQAKVLTVIVVFLVLETVNTLVNILPALRQPSEQKKRQGFIRAGVINAVLLAGCLAYLFL